MNTVEQLLNRLAAGEPVMVTAGGHSMEPRFSSGDRMRLTPWEGAPLQRGDAVFAMVGRQPRIREVSSYDGTAVALMDAVGTPKGVVPTTAVLARVERA